MIIRHHQNRVQVHQIHDYDHVLDDQDCINLHDCPSRLYRQNQNIAPYANMIILLNKDLLEIIHNLQILVF